MGGTAYEMINFSFGNDTIDLAHVHVLGRFSWNELGTFLGSMAWCRLDGRLDKVPALEDRRAGMRTPS